MTPKEAEIYFQIFDLARQGGETPTARSLGEKMGMSERWTQRIIAGLISCGELTVEGVMNGRGYGVFVFQTPEGEISTKPRDWKSDVPEDFGATKIALLPPDEREEAIDKIYAGRRYSEYQIGSVWS